MYIRLNTDVLLIRFNSIELKTWFLLLRHESFSQRTFARFNADAEIYCLVLGLMQEPQCLFQAPR